MKIVSIEQSGSWVEFEALHQDDQYLFVHHTLENHWTVLKIRPDGEREIMRSEEAAALLRDFPKQRALEMWRQQRGAE